MAYVSDGALLFALEAEKDSFPRFSSLGPDLVLEALELVSRTPDIIAVGGWHERIPALDSSLVAGYFGLERGVARRRSLFGSPVQFYSSSHERSHIFMATGMCHNAPLAECVVLVWEGTVGAFYHWRGFGEDITRHAVLSEPGSKYAAVFAIADPTFKSVYKFPRFEDAGKLMALAAYQPEHPCAEEDRRAVDQLLAESFEYPFHKERYRGTPFFDCGVESPHFWSVARYVSDAIFDAFLSAAYSLFADAGLPLVISGGCGLNCDWNQRWRSCGVFSDVFVPPCANDSGSAIGTALDAQVQAGGVCRLEWSVFSGLSFVEDERPDPAVWSSQALDCDSLAALLSSGEIIAWVQGRYEIGPRALGHRSLLASPLTAVMKDRLNDLKGRESYRPIAPCCRSEDVHRWFDSDRLDPYMLYFAGVRTDALPAVTHVDGTARVQAVFAEDNPRLHSLLGAFERKTRVSVLCNTSLNFPGLGFINRMSDMLNYCESRALNVFVVDGTAYTRRSARPLR